MLVLIGLNLILILKEIFLFHNTPDTKKAIILMLKGYYSKYFWAGIMIGTVLPLILISMNPSLIAFAGLCATIGIFLTEFVRIRVPQMIPLS